MKLKPEAIQKKVKRIDDTLDRMEQGRYTGVTIGWVTNQIAWLWKWRLISHNELSRLTGRAIYIINAYKPD